jgi:deoxyribonuclease V
MEVRGRIGLLLVTNLQLAICNPMAQTLRHRWDLTPSQAIALQKELAGRVEQTPIASPVRTIGAVDCATFDRGRQLIATAVLMAADSLEVIARAYAVAPIRMPYIPGLLSFREAPTELEAIDQLPAPPDLLMVDGAGRAHPRRLGIGAHLGLWLPMPVIGVAKSRLCGEHRSVALKRGRQVNLLDNGEVIGKVVRTRDGVKPLYISVGNHITLEEAVAWTLRTARRTRLPEPIRAAHQMAAQLKVNLQLTMDE